MMLDQVTLTSAPARATAFRAGASAFSLPDMAISKENSNHRQIVALQATAGMFILVIGPNWWPCIFAAIIGWGGGASYDHPTLLTFPR
jgi:hypothetical protein